MFSTLSTFKDFKTDIFKLLSEIKDEIKLQLEIGLSEYLDNQNQKYSNTKTFLHRNDQVPFYETFFPVSLNKKGIRIDSNDILDGLLKISRYSSIIGSAGSGKTMLIKHLFLQCFKKTFKVPIVIELRNLNDFEGSLTEFIYRKILNSRITENNRILERILEEGYFLFLLDGYDEIFSKNKSKITNDIDDFVDQYNKNFFIISSRPGADAENIPRFENFFVDRLSNKQIEDFIDMQLKELEEETLKIKIKKTIHKPENHDYKDYLSNPLLLSMFILTFNSYPEIPKTKNKFYWNVFDTLLTKHDSITKKGGFLHERKTGLSNEEIEDILKWFSYITLIDGKYSFDRQILIEKLALIKKNFNYDYGIDSLIFDLTVAISILVIDGVEYKLPHKSMHEYFTALLIKEQSPESKQKIYGDKFYKIETYSAGGNENLWTLCMELDKSFFLKIFVLPQLEEVVSIWNSKDSVEDRVWAIIKYIGFGHDISFLNDTYDEFEFLSSFWTSRPLPRLLKLLNATDYKIFELSNYERNKINKYATSFYEKGNLSIDTLAENFSNDLNRYSLQLSELPKNDFIEFSNEISMTSKIENFIEEIKLAIDKLKLEVKTEEDNKVSLLNI